MYYIQVFTVFTVHLFYVIVANKSLFIISQAMRERNKTISVVLDRISSLVVKSLQGGRVGNDKSVDVAKAISRMLGNCCYVWVVFHNF